MVLLQQVCHYLMLTPAQCRVVLLLLLVALNHFLCPPLSAPSPPVPSCAKAAAARVLPPVSADSLTARTNLTNKNICKTSLTLRGDEMYSALFFSCNAGVSAKMFSNYNVQGP
jgi:hypothetical protein